MDFFTLAPPAAGGAAAAILGAGLPTVGSEGRTLAIFWGDAAALALWPVDWACGALLLLLGGERACSWRTAIFADLS